MPPTITSPLRLLLLSAPDAQHLSLFTDTPHHEIRTAYYNASIPIWRDEAPSHPPAIASWREGWTNSEAGEVVQAIGAWVVCFKKPREQSDLDTIRSLLTTIHEVIEHHSSFSYPNSEPLLLAVGMQQSITPSMEMGPEEWEDLCRECGAWEWIDGEVVGEGGEEEGMAGVKKNEFGEKIGIARLKEALEAHEWENGDADATADADADALLDDMGFEDGFGAEAAQMEREMMGMKMAVRGEEGREEDEGADEGVQELENMMLKMQAIKDMGSDMPEAERRKFAAKAVRDVMKAL